MAMFKNWMDKLRERQKAGMYDPAYRPGNLPDEPEIQQDNMMADVKMPENTNEMTMGRSPGIIGPEVGERSQKPDTMSSLDVPEMNFNQDSYDNPSKPKTDWKRLLIDSLVSGAGSMLSGQGLIPGLAGGFLRGEQRQDTQRQDEIKLHNDSLNRQEDREWRRLTHADSLENQKENRRLREDLAKENLENKKKVDLEKYQEKLSKNLEDKQDVVNSMAQLEDQLGFKLDDYDYNTNTVGGKKVDLPGVNTNIPGIGRVSAYSRAAQDLDSTFQRIINTKIKDRSGATVTPPEFARLQKEYQRGDLNSEPQLINGIKRARDALKEAMVNSEAGFSPEVVSEYERRGGRTSKSLMRAAAKTPKTKDDLRGMSREELLQLRAQLAGAQ